MLDGWPDATLLARIQFAFTVSFHIIFPAFTIGLASYLAVLEATWLITKRRVFLDLYKHWVRVFALTFGMGVVSGLVMSYQFGTNWGPFAKATGSILGPLMGYEVLTAFFLEAGFLGVMLFGLTRVGPRLHFFATLMVAVGTLISAFWILAANSWMHTPTGHILENGIFRPGDWMEIVFNPSFPYRLVHMVTAAYLTTALVVGAAAARRLLLLRKSGEGRNDPGKGEASRLAFAMAMGMIALTAPLQAFLGDLHGLNTLEHQPAKIAAMEGHWQETISPAPLILFGLPDAEAETTRYAVEIPYLGSLILTHSLDGALQGLKAFPEADRPPVVIPFWSFRVMVGLGLLMIALGALAVWARLRGRLYDSPALYRFALLMGPAGFIAVLAGWVTTEVGRQPFVVYGLMRTSDMVSPIGAPGVAASLLAFIVVYFAVFGVGIRYLLKMMAQPVARSKDDPVPFTRAAGITPGPAEEARHVD
ncbi:cytochrome bd ubiquinol oxidase, subunit I [Rhodospirillum rubrum F11]|uniref:Cytochrome bd ubiquinol oxidase, subunit I n=3 Tax=Rhodospirillum rubrum TaxID=1085 RepID=Q2RWY1_RHORT|nr:cytochrome ubiquinol oxidase subunit I [Rhodospirillum rubrum]ABC21364.1 Cytochrome bd ubiquinol oxidase, subunit I [Rhodospirillum rubrum ATCC 11170]AEO47044.1 cytochrome bd ubiquinol oxidase, subunit I [Rhodospirillum rubrum F11]MBK5952950.1 cytochrome ubiquinol oxidase subunit I [Rhodospirillum rubrum]QXG81042.1 cytochrome ubiquinol oxidase subunit I [Rhodospirillum rubrum]HCF18487.1 cytochrome ubiquinol oxidase subunit I [Rhodospirillum rubrum]